MDKLLSELQVYAFSCFETHVVNPRNDRQRGGQVES